MTNFNGTFDTGLGQWSFYIFRPDGQQVFYNPATISYTNDLAINNINGNKNLPINVPPGNYKVVVNIITNQNFILAAAPGILSPDPAHPNTPNRRNYLYNI